MFLNNLSFSESNKLKSLKNISSILQNKVCFLNVRSTLNNVYVVITNNFGKTIFVSSGGFSKNSLSKRNTNFSLELILSALLKKLLILNIKNLFLNLDLASLRKKKIIIKTLQKSQMRVLGIQVSTLKTFNGVRPCKKRRV